MVKSKPYSGTQAVLRAISLLKVFTDDQQEWGLAELTQKVGLNKSTIFRLLTALESEEMLARNPDTDTYRLGLGIITLGGCALRTNDLRTVSRPELETLAATAKETASLELLTGAETLILDEAASERIMSGGQEIGTRWPAHVTSTGKAMLAHLPKEEVRAILPQQMVAFTPHSITDLDRLLNDLAQTRSRGYAVAKEEIELGYVAVGSPLFNYAGDVVAAISLAGPHIRLTAETIPELGRLVCDAAYRISTQLGYQPS